MKQYERTNIVLDKKLVKEASVATGYKTKRALVDYALREVMRHKAQTKLLKLKGKIHWEGDLAAMRKGRV